MNSNNKRIAKNTGLLYIRMLVTIVIGLYTSRVILLNLGEEDFGIYNVLGGVVTLFAFINNAMTSATQRFLNYQLGKDDKKKLKEVFQTSILIHILIASVILILGETIGLSFVKSQLTLPPERFSAACSVYHFSLLGTIAMILTVPFQGAIISHERMGVYAKISILDIILKLGVAIAITYVAIDRLIAYGIFLFVGLALVLGVYMVYCWRNFKDMPIGITYSPSFFKEMTGFASWSIVGNLAAVAYTQGNNILLNIFFGPSVNAARGVAVQASTKVTQFCSSFQMALNPQITKTYAAGELEQTKSLLYGSSKYSFYLLWFISLPVLVEANYVLTIWLKIVPDYSVAFFRLTIISALINAMGNPLMTAAQATGDIKRYQLTVGGILLLILPFSYISLRMGYSPTAVFIVNIIFTAIAQFIRVLFIKNMIGISLRYYFIEVGFRVLAVASLSLSIPLVVSYVYPESFFRFFLVGIACVIFTVIAVWIVGIRKEERNTILSKLKNFIKSKYARA